MALEDMAPTLEELALTTGTDGYSCMPGLETNLGELLTTAALAKPEGVCLETEDACYTFLQAIHNAMQCNRTQYNTVQLNNSRS